METPNGILRKGREVLITGCYLRTAREGCGTPRLLPTEYLVILLDEVIVFIFPNLRNAVLDFPVVSFRFLLPNSRILQDEEEDAIFIVVQLCSDTFSSVSLGDFNNGTSYSLYAR